MIKFYASNAEDKNIIEYGDIHTKKKLFKITYKKGQYLSFKKVGLKFILIGKSKSLESAMGICKSSLIPKLC